ncbi:4Fe-4S dicluster domain-containing protein [Chloroflexota bacterium]
MSTRKIDSKALDIWVNGLIAKQKVIGVQVRGDRFAFAPLIKAEDLRLDYDVTILPPKAYLQPPKETISTFRTGEGYESMIDDEPFILFGVHPYDMVAITQMDEIFSQNNRDIHYMARRDNAAVVVVDVEKVSPDVFAGHMGTAHIEDGYDILLTRIGDLYVVDARTDKGEILMADIADEPEAGESWLEQRKMVWEYNKQRLRRHDLKAPPSTWPKLLEGAYEHPQWEDKAKLCFSCGSCILVCPTCYCFDVRDDVNWDLSSGERFRVWDGCMLTNFATIAENLNFRKETLARFRHRYYRKGTYVPAKIGGQIACVGCGRCITACTANIANPVEVFNRLGESK